MTPFTDEQLKRLKEHPDYLECRCISPERHERKGGSYPKLQALLARLEAAERYVWAMDQNNGPVDIKYMDSARKDWRKAAGK